MQNKVAAFAATPNPAYGKKKPAAGRPAYEDDTADQARPKEEQADLRLVIEEDEAGGTYVYKTVNRHTGEIVQRLPREKILQLRNEAEYAAGDVIRTKA